MRAVLARMEKDVLTAESLVIVAEVVKTVGRERLVRQIAWFLMITIGATLVLLILQSIGSLNLPSDLVEKLGILFGAQIAALLGVIVKRLMA